MERSKPSELISTKISLHEVLNKTIALANDRAAFKNIKIETEFNSDNDLIEGDEQKLTMALLNILINAIEAVEENTGKIKISTGCSDQKCIITIEDNGMGMSREQLKKIFEPYFTGKPNGVGLGLATTHNIIYAHKGFIEVESEPGKGTRFIITLNLL
jgi:signal transduction histidine kinase